MPDSLNPRVAVYTGTFDPVHLGHLDIITRGSRLFDRLIVGVGINPDKSPFFTMEERVKLIRTVVGHLPNVTVKGFKGLAVSFVRQEGAGVLLRGLRTTSEMENEFTMSLMNLNLDPEIESAFLMAREPYSHLSSTLLRQIASFGEGQKLDKFLPAVVRDELIRRVADLQVAGG
jgi:pantetheine-phosphate adenylyltransferase